VPCPSVIGATLLFGPLPPLFHRHLDLTTCTSSVANVSISKQHRCGRTEWIKVGRLACDIRYLSDRLSMTITISFTRQTRVFKWWVRMQHLPPSCVGGVVPRDKIFKHGALCIKVLRPAPPFTHLWDRPPTLKMQVLSATSTEGVSAVRSGIKPNV